MKLIKEQKTIVVNTTVYRATVDLTPAEAAILFRLLNQPARTVAESLMHEDDWGAGFDHAYYDLWCKFFGNSDMYTQEADIILENY